MQRPGPATPGRWHAQRPHTHVHHAVSQHLLHGQAGLAKLGSELLEQNSIIEPRQMPAARAWLWALTPARRGALRVPDTQPDPALLRCHRSCGLSVMEGKTLPQHKGPSSPYGDARLTAAASGLVPSNVPHGHTCRGLWAAQASKPGPQIRRHRPTDPTAEHEATYCPSLRAK